jgi:oligopeptide/dipeptide ABC transporter ATP-binding protein
MIHGKELIRIKNLHKHFIIKRSFLTKLLTEKSDLIVKAVDGVSLTINEGETLGLVGESGCGKSTLGRALLHIHEPTKGEIYLRGEPIKNDKKTLNDFRKQSQIIFQNPYTSLNPRKTVRDIISVPLIFRGIKNIEERECEIISLLNRVGLSEHQINNYPHQFSGGQRQRIGIARALAINPKLVVADEPVSALDVSVQAQVINLLEELQQEHKLTYLFIAHDLSVIYYISNRVAVMYLGRIVEIAETFNLFEDPLHPYTKALLSAIPVVDKNFRRKRIILSGDVPSPINIPTGCRFHPRCYCKIGSICENVDPNLANYTDGHQVACHLYGN